jgi:guanylate kinase
MVHCTFYIDLVYIEYHFIQRAEMETMIANGEFDEWSEFSSNLYGTR